MIDDDLTTEEVKALLELAESATPGDWAHGPATYATHECRHVYTKWRPERVEDWGCDTVAQHVDDHDAEFIVASLNILPKLAQNWLLMKKQIDQLPADMVEYGVVQEPFCHDCDSFLDELVYNDGPHQEEYPLHSITDFYRIEYPSTGGGSHER